MSLNFEGMQFNFVLAFCLLLNNFSDSLRFQAPRNCKLSQLPTNVDKRSPLINCRRSSTTTTGNDAHEHGSTKEVREVFSRKGIEEQLNTVREGFFNADLKIAFWSNDVMLSSEVPFITAVQNRLFNNMLDNMFDAVDDSVARNLVLYHCPSEILEVFETLENGSCEYWYNEKATFAGRGYRRYHLLA